jgi:2-polyprenyl-3-methyl-5-hydroxy-6-metoxy-1,4-benzoquinol methylase
MVQKGVRGLKLFKLDYAILKMDLTSKQKAQEDQYTFPYHYLDVGLEEYASILSVEYLSYINIVKSLLGDTKSKYILDAGCGDGRFSYELRGSGARVIGVDYSQDAIRFAKTFNPEATFFVQDLKNLKINKKFDDIVLIETLEHILPVEIPKVLKALDKLLKKEGNLIITVPTTNSTVSEKHYQHFTEESLRQTLKNYFTVTSSSP